MTLPNLAYIAKAAVFEDTTITFLARVMVDVDNELTAGVRSDFSAITYSVFDPNASTALVGSGTLTINDVVYNTLQTGSIWSVDSTGFNFKTKLAYTLFPGAAKDYDVEFKFVLTGGTEQFWVKFRVTTVEILTS